MLQDWIVPWSGQGFRHLPDGNYNVYDFQYAGLATNNRWNVQGEATLYLAGSLDVVVGEWSRHFQFDRPQQLSTKTKRRKVYGFEVRLNQTLNLCQAEIWQELSLANAPHCFLDKKIARATAQFIRQTTDVEAIFVPSMAFLDQLDKWVLVLFLEKLPYESQTFLPVVQDFGFLNINN
ncbi:RES domain-containing protein [Crocosphaera sp. UHCC 0190]|uniref:RES domain-containing protein n=1 Tax=Crocosphaera sp. UHCC 0190 TaxID=3110246 RepID=UPI002B208F98|nr:RES domain-containing protein [Crocosphaera sp. UHCC 0190]MEA5508791.1 RES domain-containing protein [Crocosphaera sp. UHCC 0190]